MEQLQEHMNNYDVGRKLKEFANLAKSKVSSSVAILRPEANPKSGSFKPDLSEAQLEAMSRRKAAWTYSEEVNKHFLPPVRMQRKTAEEKSTDPLAALGYVERLNLLGNKCMEEGNASNRPTNAREEAELRAAGV
jgi:hypothetical protein